jgi:hypothetical protein
MIRLKRFHTFACRFYWYRTVALAFAFYMLFVVDSTPWETVLPMGSEGLFAVWFYGCIALAYIGWCVVIFGKLNREART